MRILIIFKELYTRNTMEAFRMPSPQNNPEKKPEIQKNYDLMSLDEILKIPSTELSGLGAAILYALNDRLSKEPKVMDTKSPQYRALNKRKNEVLSLLMGNVTHKPHLDSRLVKNMETNSYNKKSATE